VRKTKYVFGRSHHVTGIAQKQRNIENMLLPRQKTPDLSLPLLDGSQFSLATETGAKGTVICFYRGLHCPICATYLTELEKQTAAFAERGVNTIAISSDGLERTRDMAEKINAKALRFAYDLPLSVARDWGLFLSAGRGKTSIGIEEPDLFSEPGLFMVTPEQTLYYGSVQTMPFVRPHFSELVAALDFAISKNYPARGEYTGAV
jgi:peroxiredoxin